MSNKKLIKPKKMPVTCEIVLCGGLGNQLFMFACAAAQAVRARCAVRVVVPAADKHKHAAIEWLARVRLPMLTVADAPAGQARGVWAREVSPLCYTPVSNKIDTVASATAATRDTFVRIDGFRQSYRYFVAEWPALRTALLAALPCPTQAKEPNELEAGTLAVHVRRGDFRTSGPTFYVLPDAYYVNALACLTADEWRGIQRVSVFCAPDDAAEVAQTLVPVLQRQCALHALRNVPVAMHHRHHQQQRDADELLAMSTADALIIANSSFSWWAAWLAHTRQSRAPAVVVMPEPWFGPQSEHAAKCMDVVPGWRVCRA